MDSKRRGRKKRGILNYPKSNILFMVNSRGQPSSDDESSDDSADLTYYPEPKDPNKVQADYTLRSKKRKILTNTEENQNAYSTITWSNQMPVEILVKIFEYVLNENIIEICNLNRVCKLWYNICHHDRHLWKYIDLTMKSKQINFDKFLNYTLELDKYAFTRSLSLCGFNDIKNEDLELILEHLSVNKCLKSLNIAGCDKLRTDIFKSIANNCPCLESLDISSFKADINLQNFTYLVEKLNTNLLSLNLARDSFNNKILQVLFNNCPNLESLDLSDCCTSRIDLELFASKCKNLKYFKIIGLSRSYCLNIPKKLNSTNNLSELREIQYVHYGGPNELYNFLKICCKESLELKILNISGYKNDGQFKDNIFDAIGSNKLEYVYFTNCTFTDTDCKGFKEALKRWSHSLRHLNISWSKFSKESLDELFDVYAQNSVGIKLNSINLSGTCVDKEIIRNLIMKLQCLKEINLSSCRQIDRGLKRLINIDDMSLKLLTSFF